MHTFERIVRYYDKVFDASLGSHPFNNNFIIVSMNAGFIFHTETTATFHNHRVSPHADAASTIIRNAINFLPRFVFRLRIMYALGKFEFIVGRSSRSMAGGGGSI